MVESKKKKEKFYRELRCPVCRKLLFKEYIYEGRVQIKCTNCKPKRLLSFVFKSARNIVEYQDVKDKKETKNI